MEIDLEKITKEESLNIINTLINKSGITKKEVNESYNSSNITNKDKKNVVRIRLMSQNEAILKLMVPYGNKQNLHGTYSYPYPWQISEGKYGFKHICRAPMAVVTSNATSTQCYTNELINKIDTTVNLYEYSYAGSTIVGFLAQNANWIGFSNRSNGYGLCYQDNYEDKPEIRVQTHHNQLSRYWKDYRDDHSYYSKNGDAIGNEFLTSTRSGNTYFDDHHTQTHVTNYKTSTMQYQGLFPVLAVAS